MTAAVSSFIGSMLYRKTSFRKKRRHGADKNHLSKGQLHQRTLSPVNNSPHTSRNDLAFVSCTKNKGHDKFVPIESFSSIHLPNGFSQKEQWAKIIQLRGSETVRLEINYTSSNRPDSLGFKEYIGKQQPRYGCGTVFQGDMKNKERCTKECREVKGEHFVSGLFKVVTAAHVVFDDDEARNTTIDFFYDNEDNTSSIVRAKGVRVSEVDVEGNRSVIECRTHDLQLWDRLENCRTERDQLFQEITSDTNQKNDGNMVLLISHPHGKAKHVSIGELLEVRDNGDVRTTSDGVRLIGCVLAYTTPTCNGTGGGSVSLIQGGKFIAFVPHCAAREGGENVSGLGWMKK